MVLYLRYALKALNTIQRSKKYLSFQPPNMEDCQKTALNYLLSNRRRQYLYSLFLFGSAWAVLRNKNLTETEMERLALLSVVAPLFDDLFDTYHLYPDLIETLVLDPGESEMNPDNTLLKCFRIVLLSLYESLHLSERFFRQLVLQLIRAQEKSRNLLWHAPASDIESVTREKGGLAAVLIRNMLDDPVTQKEYQVALSLGFLAQLMDDLFDLTSDRIDGRVTSACLFSNVNEARSFFLKTEKYWFTKCSELPFPEERILHFVRYMHLLLSPVFVCLDYYEIYSHRMGINLFNRTLQNSVLVCDMEKWSNRFRLLLLASKNSKLVLSHQALL